MKTQIANLQAQLQHGVIPAMATPLCDDGYTVNTAVTHKLVDFLIERQVKGIFVGGTTGEGVLLAHKQRKILHEAVVEAVADRVPVLIHIGTNTTAASLDLTDHALEIGADVIVAMTPYFMGMPDTALFDYFQTLANCAADIPFMAYDIPQVAINGVSPELLTRLAQEIPNFAGLKCSRTDMQIIRKLLDTLPEDKFMLVGNEAIALGSLALGAVGLISGLATAVPEPFHAFIQAFFNGEHEQALKIHKRINQALNLLPAGARIGAIKLILADRGIPVGPMIPPRPMPATSPWKQMESLLLDL